MGDFNRGLCERKRAALQRLHDSKTDNWWKDLLSFWVPSGIAAGPHGLRLAIRDGYLNFYRRGQSVARISFGAPISETVEARMSIHAKYVWKGFEAQRYAHLIHQEVLMKGSGTVERRSAKYDGRATLKSWIENTADWHGEEKRSVDAIVGNNPTVVDLEMGMPAWGSVTSALRVDLVSLHPSGATPKLVLWEVKPLNSGHLRSKGEAAILRQMASYRLYLDDPKRRAVVQSAYMKACADLAFISKMANKAVDPIICEASQALEVDSEPGLILCKGISCKDGVDKQVGYDAASWSAHLAKLEGASIKMIIEDDARMLKL